MWMFTQTLFGLLLLSVVSINPAMAKGEGKTDAQAPDHN